MKFNYVWMYFIFCLCFLSCNFEYKIDYTNKIKIISPVENWKYSEDSLILFSTNVNTEEIIWTSNIDGYLGKGNGFTKYLSNGEHIIKCNVEGYVKSVKIIINKNFQNKNIVNTFLLNNIENVRFFDSGNYNSCIFNLSENSNNAIFEAVTPLDNSKKVITRKQFNIINQNKNMSVVKVSNSRSLNSNEQLHRKFYVIKTDNQFEEPHIISASVNFESEHCKIWIPDDLNCDNYDINLIKECVSNFENIIYERLINYWGEWADIDGDEKIALLFTPTINEEKFAIGFFNSSDYYLNDENNPYSNNCDILYLAIPEEESLSYCVNSISATIAHELTHAITYNYKTFRDVVNGNANPVVEELFLNEGWSHLSENLCGFGVSGGNILFLEEYLQNTTAYSFNGDNLFGNGDTAGNRGAICLLLSWCYWETEKKTSNGTEFLYNMESSTSTGLDCIIQAYNNANNCCYNVEKLFQLFINDMLEKYNASEAQNYLCDCVTGEPVEFFINMKNFENTKPFVYSNSESLQLMPFSVAFMEKIYIENPSYLSFLFKDFPNNTYLSIIADK